MDSDYSIRYSDSESSDRSYHSHSTAPTDHSTMPPLTRHDTCYGRLESAQGHRQYGEVQVFEDPRESVETYASTLPSEEDLEKDMPAYELPQYRPEFYYSDAIPATPADFSELFPSSRRLAVCHDDSTSDGNMNLRIDTHVQTTSGRIRNITLFHLRMHDLKNREFSLRRYCRDSGREVCHSTRKLHKPAAEKRPGFQSSLSNALASFRSKSDSKTPTNASLKRSDSGYESMYPRDDDNDAFEARPKSAGSPSKSRAQPPTNMIKLEFSNYAQVEVKRRGTKGNKRYEFEYWGINYQWKRVIRKDGQSKQISYHLFRAGSERPLAHIVPVPLTTAQEREERTKGGWVPPCSMWINDEDIVRPNTDVAE